MSHPPKTQRQSPASPSGATDTLLLIAPGLIWGASFLFIAEGLRVLAQQYVLVEVEVQ